jgi:preprotein translocase subunit SecE
MLWVQVLPGLPGEQYRTPSFWRRFKREKEVAVVPENVVKTNRLTRWFRETIGELRKVNWPTTQETWNLTKIVLVVMLVMALLLGLIDFVFSTVITGLVA